jgi:hypothetical protein
MKRTCQHKPDALHQIETGNEPQAPRAAIDRVDERTREYGPLEGPTRAAEERIAAKKAVKDQADSRAVKIIERAIRADEADAAALTSNPVEKRRAIPSLLGCLAVVGSNLRGNSDLTTADQSEAMTERLAVLRHSCSASMRRVRYARSGLTFSSWSLPRSCV